MFIVIRKIHILILALILCVVGLTIGVYNNAAEPLTTPPAGDIIVVDAGHGE